MHSPAGHGRIETPPKTSVSAHLGGTWKTLLAGHQRAHTRSRAEFSIPLLAPPRVSANAAYSHPKNGVGLLGHAVNELRRDVGYEAQEPRRMSQQLFRAAL